MEWLLLELPCARQLAGGAHSFHLRPGQHQGKTKFFSYLKVLEMGYRDWVTRLDKLFEGVGC